MREYIILYLLICLCICLCRNALMSSKKALAFAFILIGIFLAFRYDYGLDYWSYYDEFINEYTDKAGGERLFYMCMSLFPKYYQFIIFHSIILSYCLYYVFKKYVYAGFYMFAFFLLFFNPSMLQNLLSAQRSALAACILWLALSYFYIEKNSLKTNILYCAAIFIAASFHTSAVVFLLFPLFHLFISRKTWSFIFIFLLLSNVLGSFLTNKLAISFFNSFEQLARYSQYTDSLQEANVFGFILKSFLLFPTYYICKYYTMLSDSNKKMAIVSFFFLTIYLCGFDMQGRMSAYLYIYFIAIFSVVSHYLTKQQKLISYVPLLFVIFMQFYVLISRLTDFQYSIYSEGNPLYYQTIFDAPYLP